MSKARIVHAEDSKDTTACGAETARARVPVVMTRSKPPVAMTTARGDVTCKSCLRIIASRENAAVPS